MKTALLDLKYTMRGALRWATAEQFSTHHHHHHEQKQHDGGGGWSYKHSTTKEGNNNPHYSTSPSLTATNIKQVKQPYQSTLNMHHQFLTSFFPLFFFTSQLPLHHIPPIHPRKAQAGATHPIRPHQGQIQGTPNHHLTRSRSRSRILLLGL